jgi:predicted MPP superfamily phosphohydrolase
MSDVRLGILHLTDLHVGQPEHENYFPTIRTEFLLDLERCYAKSGPWDLVVFSGDLAFSGTKQQYQAVEKFIKELQNKLIALGSPDAVLLAVPGNHDLQRASDTDPVAEVLANLATKSETEASAFWSTILNDPKSHYRRSIDDMFGEYTKWWMPHAEKARKKLELRTGVLPGEFAAVLTKSECQFAIVGLNTTYLQLKKGDFDGRLAVHAQQLAKLAPSPDEYDWLERMDAAILVTHQPPSWLSRVNRENVFEPLINPPRRFVFHLCGHLHLGHGHSESIGGSAERRLWLARALEAFDPTEDGTDRTFGYQALEIIIHADSREGSFCVWPRRAEKIQGNEWRFGPDASYVLEDEGTRRGIPSFRFERPNAKSVSPSVGGSARSPSPGCRLTPEPSPPNLTLTVHTPDGDPTIFTPSGIRVMFYHLKVINQRPWLPAQSCRVMLMGLSRRDPSGIFQPVPMPVPFQFVWAPAEITPPSITLVREQVLDLGYILENGSAFVPRLYGIPNNFRGFVGPNEAVRYQLQIEAVNSSSPLYVVEVAWDGVWSYDPDTMMHHLSIRHIQ